MTLGDVRVTEKEFVDAFQDVWFASSAFSLSCKSAEPGKEASDGGGRSGPVGGQCAAKTGCRTSKKRKYFIFLQVGFD